jgi:hypothetical protein
MCTLIGKTVFICFHVKSSNYNELPRRKKPSDAGLDDILSPRLHENQMAVRSEDHSSIAINRSNNP